MDAVIAEKGISLSPTISMQVPPGPLTFRQIILAADFELVHDLTDQYPEYFEHVHGLLYCLFNYGWNNPERDTFTDINLEKFTLLFDKLLLQEPETVLFDSLFIIHLFLHFSGKEVESEPEHCHHAVAIKLREYEAGIIRELEKRKFLAPEGLPIEIHMISRMLEAKCPVFPGQNDFDRLTAIACTSLEQSLDNNNERLRWLTYLRDNTLPATAILFHAITENNLEVIQQMASAGVQINTVHAAFQARIATRVIDSPLLHAIAADFNLRTAKCVLVETLRNRLRNSLPISRDIQRNYQALTGEVFDEDQILEPENYRYDHTVVLATPSAFDCFPRKLCIKHPGRTTLYEWSIKSKKLRLVQGIERPFTGNYKIIINSHGNGIAISDESKYLEAESPLRGRYVADRLHQLIMKKNGNKPAKITLIYCSHENNSASIDFQTMFTNQIAHLNYQTILSVPRIGCPYISAKTGRKAYLMEPFQGRPSNPLFIRTPINNHLCFREGVQTKDKEQYDYFIGLGYERVNNMRITYRVGNGVVTELADPDLPGIV